MIDKGIPSRAVHHPPNLPIEAGLLVGVFGDDPVLPLLLGLLHILNAHYGFSWSTVS